VSINPDEVLKTLLTLKIARQEIAEGLIEIDRAIKELEDLVKSVISVSTSLE